jgi:hypothetical protein
MYQFRGDGVKLTRKQNWPVLLAEQIKAAAMRPFSFGSHDCLLFAADVALAMTDIDFAAGVRGTYNDERSALEVIKAHGSMVQLARHCFGEPIDTKFAQRGDVVLVMRGGRESLAVCEGARACGPGALGLEWASMTEALLAWKV